MTEKSILISLKAPALRRKVSEGGLFMFISRKDSPGDRTAKIGTAKLFFSEIPYFFLCFRLCYIDFPPKN